ncbi:MAG: HD domain-containing protein [Rhodospirillaceae bacterium]|nr:HD domain-containing protein [Rhodospirillaceae bacterium]
MRQLGLAHLVFPGAGYSRFAHSVGACHVVGMMIEALRRNTKEPIQDEQIQLYRLAALLHDVGHYPFSHALEEEIDNHYKGTSFLAGGAIRNKEDTAIDGEPPSYNHELLGKRIIENDSEIATVLKAHNVNLEDLKAVFSKQDPLSMTALISSDLDCDRLDYLRRTAYHAGTPYGDVDIGYIVSQTTLDKDRRVCFKNKALKAADHLLVSRYYDYLQLPFHKTVVALEIALKEVFRELLKLGYIDCSSDAILKRIKESQWKDFDDQHVISLFRQAVTDPKVQQVNGLQKKIQSILLRTPPKLIVASERIDDTIRKKDHKGSVQQLNDKLDSWAKETGIDRTFWYVWQRSLQLTKIGAKVPFSDAKDLGDEERSQLVHILGHDTQNGGVTSTPLIECQNTLINSLSEKAYYGIRLYVLLEGSEPEKAAKKKEIQRIIYKELPDFPFVQL